VLSPGDWAPAGPALEHDDLLGAQFAAESDQVGGVAGDTVDLVPGLLDGGGGVDPKQPSWSSAGFLQRGESGDHSGVRGPGDRAHDDGVEEHVELLLLLGHLVGPVDEAESAEPVLGGAGGDGIGRAATCCDVVEGVLPRLADADVEPGRVEPYVGAHDPRQQDVADFVVDRVVPVNPALLHEPDL
jgi:hypothetical protein